MRRVVCAECRQAFPMNEGFAFEGRELCGACADKEAQRRAAESLPLDAVQRLVDPTICGLCGRDNASVELPRVGAVPVCGECEQAVRNRPFPQWLRAGLAVLAALAVLSFWWNRRFVEGYVALARSNHAFQQGQLDRAASLMDEALRRVPEFRPGQGLRSFYRGLRALREDRSEEAVRELTQAKLVFGSGELLDRALLHAQAGAAFEDKDYDGFLKWEHELLKRYPSEARVEAGVASAYACKYAVSGDASFEAAARAHLDKARKLVKEDETQEFGAYEERILHRLESREIIDAKEYRRRFPQGRRADR